MFIFFFALIVNIVCFFAVGETPDWGSGWTIALAVEICLDFPLLLLIMSIVNRYKDSKEMNEEDDQAEASDPEPEAVTGYEIYSCFAPCNSYTPQSGKNPYAQGTVRWYAWEERNGQNRKAQ